VKEEILFSIRELIELNWHEDLSNSSLTRLRLNEDHSLLSFIIDVNNSETYFAGVKNLSTGKILVNELINLNEYINNYLIYLISK